MTGKFIIIDENLGAPTNWHVYKREFEDLEEALMVSSEETKKNGATRLVVKVVAVFKGE